MGQPVPLEDLPDDLRPAQPAAQRPGDPGALGAFALGLGTNVPGLQTVSAHAATAARNPGALAQFMKGQTGREQPLGYSASPRDTMGPMQGDPYSGVEDRARPPADPRLTGPYQQALDQRLGATENFVQGAQQAHPTAFAAGEWAPLAEAAAPALGRAAASYVGPKLGSWAEQNAIRAMGAPSAVGRLAEREGEQRVPQVARAMLDEGVPLSSPADAKAGLLGAMSDKYGPAIGALTQEAENRGGVFNMKNVITDFRQRAAEMAKDPQQRPIIDAVQNYLAEVAKARGNWPDAGGQRQLFNMSPQEAHKFRQNLDTFLYGVKRNLDPTGTLTKATFNSVRQSVDGELGRVMNDVGLGQQWAPANAGYRNMSAGLKLAKAGVKADIVKQAGTGEDTILSRLKDLKFPGPSPATKANVQNTLYRLMSPAPPEANMSFKPFRSISGGSGGPDEPFTGPKEGFTLWRPSEGEPPIPRDPNAYTPAPPEPPQPYQPPTPEERAQARADVLANKKSTYQLLHRTGAFKKPPKE